MSPASNHQVYCMFLGPHGAAFISASSQVSNLQLCLQEQEGSAAAHDDTHQREAFSLQALWTKVGVQYKCNHQTAQVIVTYFTFMVLSVVLQV